MRYLALYLLALLCFILTAGYVNSEPKHGTQPGYEVWGTSYGIPEVWFTEDTEEDGLLGIVTHYNQSTSPNSLTEDLIQLDTPAGPVTVQIIRTPNIDCMPVKLCPDTLEVYDVPDGYIAVPSFHTLDEDSFGHIRIVRYTGT